MVDNHLRHFEPDECGVAEYYRRCHSRQLLSTLWPALPP